MRRVHVVAVHLQRTIDGKVFKRDFTIEMGGNCRGWSVLSSSVESVVELAEIPEEQLRPEDTRTEDEFIDIALYAEDGDVLWVEYGDLPDSVVGAEILEVRPE